MFLENLEEIVKFRLFIAGIFAFIVLVFSTPAFAQVSVPDFGSWPSQSGNAQASMNGRPVSLSFHFYENVDEVKMLEQALVVWNDENGKPWFLYYSFLQHTADHTNEKEQFHFFEYRDSQWVHVKDFTNNDNRGKEAGDLLKNRYGLEFSK